MFIRLDLEAVLISIYLKIVGSDNYGWVSDLWKVVFSD